MPRRLKETLVALGDRHILRSSPISLLVISVKAVKTEGGPNVAMKCFGARFLLSDLWFFCFQN